MSDRSHVGTVELPCRCGTTVAHEHWDVIDEAQRADLVSELIAGHLDRVRCDGCGRTLFADEPVAVVRTVAATPLIILFTDRAPDHDTLPSIDELPVMWAPSTAAPYLLTRDLDADAAAPYAARAEVEQSFGPAAGFTFAEALRHFVVVTDPLDVLTLFEPLVDTDLAGFQALLADHPEFASDTFQQSTERIAAVFPDQAATLNALGRLMSDAKTDAAAAWMAFQTALAQISENIRQLLPDLQRLNAAHEQGHHEDVISQGTSLVERCHDAGAFLDEGNVSEMLALALLQAPSQDRAARVEEVVRLLTRAVDRSGNDNALRARRLSHLAMAYMHRVTGDRRDNLEATIDLGREAIGLIGDTEPDLRAALQTNLAFALTERESNNPVDDLTEAYDLCQAALTRRSPERNANDWAYSQVNLGAVLSKLAGHGRARHRDARRMYASVLPFANEVDAEVIATVRTNVTMLDRIHHDRTFTGRRRNRRLRASRDLLAAQLVELADAGPVARGRALHELARVELALGERASAIARLEQATELLRPEISPSDCASAATTLAPLLAGDGDWPGASSAFVDAVTATDLRFYERVSAADREAEARDRGNLSRWAAYAIARQGNADYAALVLEDGRTRELRLRLGADDEQRTALRAAAPELLSEYEQALADMARAELVDDADAAALRHRRTLDQIRAVPGLERFGGPMTSNAVTAAAADGQPLVYINPTPWGTVVLTIQSDGTVQMRFLDVTSTTVTERLMFGLDENGRQTPPSYLAAVSQDGAGIEQALASTLGWVGETLARPVAEELRRTHANAAALVPCGLLGQFPAHVAPWTCTDGVAQTLADQFDITFAPSAALHAAARRRVQDRVGLGEAPTLVAVADPVTGYSPLPASRAEVSVISTWFDPENQRIGTGTDASATFLRDHAAQATYLHLACHAFGATFDFRTSRLALADGDLPLTDLFRIGPLTSRLAVASACQTVLPDAALSDEAYSIGAILLAAGTASAIASLWPVDDLATALLMIKLYESLFQDDLPPSQALRRAQTWLRDLSRARAEVIITSNQALADEATRRHAIGEDMLPIGEEPFADPSYWGAFIALGV